jgi:hypothetical protein
LWSGRLVERLRPVEKERLVERETLVEKERLVERERLAERERDLRIELLLYLVFSSPRTLPPFLRPLVTYKTGRGWN